MIVAESRRGRRIVGRMDRGSDLFAALLSICRGHAVRAGEVRAFGALESAVIADFDQGRRGYRPARTLAGAGLQVLNLLGNVSEHDGELALHVHATLMRDQDSGVQVLGGHLMAARVFELEFVIESYDDVVLRRGADEATGLPQWRDAIDAPPATGASATATSAATTSAAATSATATSASATSATAPVAAPTPAPPSPSVRPPPAASPAASPVASPAATAVAAPAAPPTTAHASSRTAHGSPPPSHPSWADVAAASARADRPALGGSVHDETAGPAPAAPAAAARATRAEAEEDEPDVSLEPGDVIVHPTFGRCEVQRIEGSYEFAQVRLRNGRLVRLSLDVLRLTSAGREDNRRVFKARIAG